MSISNLFIVSENTINFSLKKYKLFLITFNTDGGIFKCVHTFNTDGGILKCVHTFNTDGGIFKCVHTFNTDGGIFKCVHPNSISPSLKKDR